MKKFFLLILFIFGGVVVIFQDVVFKSNWATSTPSSMVFAQQKPNNPYDICTIEDYPDWNDDVQKDQATEASPKCSRAPLISRIKDGVVYVRDSDYKCKYRCFHWETERKVAYSGFIDIKPNGTATTCEFLEVRCSKKGKWISELQTQIIKKTPKKVPQRGPRFNVFVVLVDSTSRHQSYRNFPKTVRLLKDRFEAVDFKYLNKIGLNSRPNSFVFWFNKQMVPNRRDLIGMNSTSSDAGFGSQESCKRYLDNTTSVFSLFRKNGYLTMMAEDCDKPVLLWPNCKGYSKPPIDYFMRPAQIHLFDNSNKKNLEYMESKCITPSDPVADYFSDFIKSETEAPKFGWAWFTTFSHNFQGTSANFDSFFIDFIERNQEEIDNSFFIFMGDHGLRFGEYSKTEQGTFENSNPMLFISVPKELRQTTNVLKNLRDNSAKLQTHFDVFHTLSDISMRRDEFDWIEDEPLPSKTGNSLLRKQPDFERTCKSLNIPLSFCLCTLPKIEEDRISSIAIEIGEYVEKRMNQKIVEFKGSAICKKFEFEKILSIYRLASMKKGLMAYQVLVKFAAPSNAVFSATIYKSFENGKTILDNVGGIDRIDSYGRQGYCIAYAAEQYCYCKKQHKNSSNRDGWK